MNKIKLLNKINFIAILTLILYLHIGSFLISINIISVLTFSKILHALGIIFIIIYIINKIINKKNINFYDIIILLLTTCAIISAKYAYDQEVALIGTHHRHEGLYTILSYYSFFLLSTTLNKKYHPIIMKTLVFLGVFQILIGTIQTMRIENILGYDRSENFSANYYSASGTFMNPNFYSTYILICVSYLIGNFKNQKTIKTRIISIFLISIYVYGLIIGNTSSSILSFIAILIFNGFGLLNKKNIKKNLKTIPIIIVVILLAIPALLIVDKYKYHTLYKTMRNNVYEIMDIFKYGIKDTTGNSRIYVWKETLKEVPKHALTGIGIDNFLYIKDGQPILATVEEKVLAFDKAHNDYLQILITEGVFALIVYLILIIKVLYDSHSISKNKNNSGLILSFISYLCQMIMVFSVIMVAPIFYIIIGFIVHNKKEEKEINI